MPARKKKPVPVTALRTQGHTKGENAVLSVQTARILERRYKVLDMRRQGYSMDAISKVLECTVQTVSEDIKEVLGQTATKLLESTEEARNLEVERLDALLKRYQPLAEAGNLAAASLCLSIGDRRRKMLALDMPEARGTQETGIRVYVGIDIDEV